jgi:hypothetical protein
VLCGGEHPWPSAAAGSPTVRCLLVVEGQALLHPTVAVCGRRYSRLREGTTDGEAERERESAQLKSAGLAALVSWSQQQHQRRKPITRERLKSSSSTAAPAIIRC